MGFYIERLWSYKVLVQDNMTFQLVISRGPTTLGQPMTETLPRKAHCPIASSKEHMQKRPKYIAHVVKLWIHATIIHRKPLDFIR